MAYTTPPTFVADDVLEADQLNVLSDDIIYLKGISDGTTWSAVHVSRAAAQSITTGTDTAVSFDTENHDSGGWWSSGTNIVVPAGAVPAGYTTIALHAIAAANFALNSVGVRRVLILVNGSEADRITLSALSSDPTIVVLNTYLIVEAGDIITMEVYHTKGSSLNLAAGGIWLVRHAPVA